MSEIDIALAAVRLYAETHPRPPHVTQKEAAEMLRMSEPTIRKLIQSGALKLNRAGRIPIAHSRCAALEAHAPACKTPIAMMNQRLTPAAAPAGSRPRPAA